MPDGFLMNEMHPAGFVTVEGVKHNVSVGDDGNWYAWPQGNKIMQNSKIELVSALRKYHRKQVTKVEIPFTQLIPDLAAIRRGVATGIHARTGLILVRWSDGEPEQVSPYDRCRTGELTPEQAEQWAEARRRWLIAHRDLTKFESEHGIDLYRTVQDALDGAVVKEEQQ